MSTTCPRCDATVQPTSSVPTPNGEWCAYACECGHVWAIEWTEVR